MRSIMTTLLISAAFPAYSAASYFCSSQDNFYELSISINNATSAKISVSRPESKVMECRMGNYQSKIVLMCNTEPGAIYPNLLQIDKKTMLGSILISDPQFPYKEIECQEI